LAGGGVAMAWNEALLLIKTEKATKEWKDSEKALGSSSVEEGRGGRWKRGHRSHSKTS